MKKWLPAVSQHSLDTKMSGSRRPWTKMNSKIFWNLCLTPCQHAPMGIIAQINAEEYPSTMVTIFGFCSGRALVRRLFNRGNQHTDPMYTQFNSFSLDVPVGTIGLPAEFISLVLVIEATANHCHMSSDFAGYRMARQWAETLVEIRGTLSDIRGTTK